MATTQRHIVALLLLSVFSAPLTAQWAPIPGFEYSLITSFLTVNDSVYFVGGHYGLLSRSTNAGSSWHNVWGNGMSADTILTLGKGGTYIYAGTYGLYSVSRSSDLGDHWSVANSGLPPNVVANAFEFTDQRVFVATSQGVYVSGNDGVSWTGVDVTGMSTSPPASPPYAWVRDIVLAHDSIYAVTMYDGVFVSPLDVYAWTSLGTPSQWGTSIVHVDTLIFMAASEGVFVYTGSGEVWEKRSEGLPEYNNEAILLAADSLLVLYSVWGTSETGFYASHDLGVHWSPVSFDVFTNKVVRSLAATTTEVFAATESGAWRIATASLRTVGVRMDGPSMPTGFRLEQNYPNPFNPVTFITFTIPVAQRVTLSVHDVLGRTVASVFDAESPAGSHVIPFDASGLTSGPYFVRIEAGRFRAVRSIMLVR